MRLAFNFLKKYFFQSQKNSLYNFEFLTELSRTTLYVPGLWSGIKSAQLPQLDLLQKRIEDDVVEGLHALWFITATVK